MAESKLSILVQALGAAKAAKDLKGVDKAISNIGAKGGQGLRTAGSNLAHIGVIAGGVAAAGLVGAIKVAADFESQLNTINTIARVLPDELDKIGLSIRKVAKDTGTPLADLSQGYYDLLSAGIQAADAPKVLTAANTLAIGGLSTTAEAVDLLTTAINVYGGDASQAGKFTDEFAKAIERGKVTAAELAASYAQVAPLAKELGLENAELAAGYARLTASGTPAAEASTQMASALTALLKKTPQLEKLEKATSKNYAAIAGSKGLNVALEEMRVDAEKGGLALVDLVGRKEALLYILQTTGPNLAAYNADLAAMGTSAGTAAAQMAERQQGLNFHLKRLKALAIDAGIVIGNKLLPKLTPLAEKAVAFLTTHESDISAFGDKIAAGFDKALDFATKIPWGTIGAGLQVAAEWAGKLFDAFLSLPPEMQATIVALAGLNKLSGGAISGIVGELGKGLIKGVLGMNAAVVNINAASVNGGVPGVGGAGKGGGIIGGLGTAIGLVTIAGITVAAGQALADAMGATPENPVTGASRGFYRDENGTGMSSMTKPRPQGMSPDERQEHNDTQAALARIAAEEHRAGERATGAATAQTVALGMTREAIVQGRIVTANGMAAVVAAERAVAAAIHAKDLSVNFTAINNVTARVTVRGVSQSTQISNRIGYQAT